VEHAWCRDPSRDERVRAAEDGRDRPLPTLKECIAGVTESMSGNAGGEEMEQNNFAEPAERSVPVSKTGEGQSGMRTERITLEVKHGEPYGVSHWSWVTILRLQSGESVRVVSDEEREEFPSFCPIAGGTVVVNGEDMVTLSEFLRHTTRLTQEAGVAKRQRDAAICERDELRKQVVAIKEQSHDRWRSMNNALCELSKVRSERDALQARVAELEATSGGGEQPRGWLTGEERQNLEEIVVCLDDDNWPHAAAFVRSLLARSTPPSVVLDAFPTDETGEFFSRRDVIAALAAAGVAVKEVGRE